MIIYLKNKDTLVVKDFKFRCCIGKKGIELHPRNDKYKTIHISENDDMQIQGKVLGVFREYN